MQSHLTLLISLLLPMAFALPNPASHSRITAENIFDLSHDSSRFIREAGDDNEPTTSTDQCPEAKYEAFFDRYDNCMNAAQSIIDEVGSLFVNTLKLQQKISLHLINFRHCKTTLPTSRTPCAGQPRDR